MESFEIVFQSLGLPYLLATYLSQLVPKKVTSAFFEFQALPGCQMGMKQAPTACSTRSDPNSLDFSFSVFHHSFLVKLLAKGSILTCILGLRNISQI